MKNIASIAIATLSLFAVSAAQAKDKCHSNKSSFHGGCLPVPHCTPHFCPPTIICTKEIDRCYHSKSGFDSHGCFVHYKVLVITYASYYSNGTTRTFTRTYNV